MNLFPVKIFENSMNSQVFVLIRFPDKIDLSTFFFAKTATYNENEYINSLITLTCKFNRYTMSSGLDSVSDYSNSTETTRDMTIIAEVILYNKQEKAI